MGAPIGRQQHLLVSAGFGPEQAIAIATAIYTAQAAFSAWWLGRFRFGPMEWLWRSLTYGELQRHSRASVPVADLPAADLR